MNFNTLQILFSLTTLVCLSQSAKIGLYDNTWHEGETVVVALEDGECLNLEDVGMAFRVMSINTHGNCVYLYDSADCKGEQLRVAPGTPCHYDLSGCKNDFYRKARSMILCN